MNRPDDTIMTTKTFDPNTDPKTIICFQDGDMWCAAYGDFDNFEESPTWWGSGPIEAVQALVNREE